MLVLPPAIAVGLKLLRFIDIVIPIWLLHGKVALVVPIALDHFTGVYALPPLALVLATVVVVDGLFVARRGWIWIIIDRGWL